jgi:hypothetical protein
MIGGLVTGIVSSLTIATPPSLLVSVLDGDELDECAASSIADTMSLGMAVMGLGFRDTAATYIGWLGAEPRPGLLLATIPLVVIAHYVAMRLPQLESGRTFNLISTISIVAVSVMINPWSIPVLVLGIIAHECDVHPGLFLAPLVLLPLLA